jgi:hypothetical protein
MSNANTKYLHNVTIKNNLDVDNGLLFVDVSNSKVGIGTKNPQYELDISGSVRIRTSFAYYGYNPNLNGFNTFATAIGIQAGETVASSGSIAIGYLAGQNRNLTNNVMIGYQAGQNNTTGGSGSSNSIGIGFQVFNTLAINNGASISLGYQSCQSTPVTSPNTTGNYINIGVRTGQNTVQT